ncbi:MAG: DUF3800 domain-containing protein [Prevotellaceae bacterium]|jgi:hypothetical protein|nr:DUF3800 domain-containing protein [Prevotellaceae bacterium]
MEYNVYCDESCHLEKDNINVMALGAIWCLKEKKHEIFKRIKEIKSLHNISPNFEIKWNKVSPAKKDFYLNLIDYFFDDDDIYFRALIIPDKTKLNHIFFQQTHDDFYYKMYFNLLKVILTPTNSYNIFIDIKDTKSQEKVEKLKTVLQNSHYDFDKTIIKNLQQIRSNEVELLPLADLLIGAITYHHRKLQSNTAKLKIIKRIQERSKYSLYNSTLYRENKMNLFVWKSQNTTEQ